VGRFTAAELIAEIGVDMTRFPSAGHLVSWARFCPNTHASAGKTKPKGRTKGNPWLAASIGNTIGALTRTPTFLGARYRRIARRRGKGKAMVAAGNSLLTSVYHLLCDPETVYQDLGPHHHDTLINRDRRARHLAAALEAVTGQKIFIQHGKAVVLDTEAA